MGMFDYVNFRMACPNCHAVMSCQTKAADCVLDTIEPDTVDYFKCYCHLCRVTVSFSRPHQELPSRAVPLTAEQLQTMGYEMVVNMPDGLKEAA